jgi:DNA-binding response OmpR family regulator
MPNRPRILFVDDEPSIRITLSAILQHHGFQVTVASTVAEALALITAEHYDVLLSDLNIGQPGDGFTVVSAMRRVQPEAVTLILTGYPAFETALRAIREQVDDFLTKPADVETLVASIKAKLLNRHAPLQHKIKRLSAVIAEHKAEIVDDWYRRAEQNSELGTVQMSREQRIDHLPQVLEDLILGEPESSLGNTMLDAAAAHGVTRRRQGYSVPMLIEESRILNGVLASQINEHLLDIEISFLINDMGSIADRLHVLLRRSMSPSNPCGKR